MELDSSMGASCYISLDTSDGSTNRVLFARTQACSSSSSLAACLALEQIQIAMGHAAQMRNQRLKIEAEIRFARNPIYFAAVRRGCFFDVGLRAGGLALTLIAEGRVAILPDGDGK